MIVSPTSTRAAEPVLRQFCETGSAGGQCLNPRGIAVDKTSGDAYVADLGNGRIQKFTAWGQFLRAWGWDVVASGPGDDTIPPEDEFEICVPANGDECKAGPSGPSSGQFGAFLTGLAVDSSGDVYVVDRSNQRVQKFDSEGNFLLMFGGQVNKTKVEAAAPVDEQNRCPIDPGDVCQAGSLGTGSGQFGDLGIGSFIAASPGGGTIYVGDEGRIQEFDAEGRYLGDLSDPTGLLAENAVQSLAADPGSGDLYVTFLNKGFVGGKATPPNVHRLDESTGEILDELAVGVPSGVAVDSAGHVYVFDGDAPGSTSESGNHFLRVLEFDSAGGLIGVFDQNISPNTPSSSSGDKFSAASTGLATSSACGIEGSDLFVSNPNPLDSFVRIYGPPPDIDLCPPPSAAPTISSTHAFSVDTDGATVRARINPHFWDDTSYRVQYGTSKCSEGGCEETPPVQLGAGVVDSHTKRSVFLGAEEPLAPDNTYHYRFVSESSGGGPTFGEELTFRTFAMPSTGKADCPNQGFRGAARLPDCRAYELVSPLDKNNSDIAEPFDGHDMGSIAGDAFTFTVLATGFGNPAGGPFAHQYLSSRDPNVGWSTRSIVPPRELPPLVEVLGSFDSHFRAFSEDLCSAWVVQDTDVALAPGAPEGVPNLYRRDNCGEGEGTYELITTVAPTEPVPGFSRELEPVKGQYYLQPQGNSADGHLSVFRAPAKLTEDASNKDLRQLYAYSKGQLRVVSVRPNGIPVAFHASLGTWEGAAVGGFKSASVHNAVSEDGLRIFWSASATDQRPTRVSDDDESSGSLGGVGGVQNGPLYVRLNPLEESSEVKSQKCQEPAKACTVEISNAASTRYVTAARDGSFAIYSVGEQLFEFDVAKGTAYEAGASSLIANGVKGILGASADVSRIYLVSTEVLDTGAATGKPNLYLYERGVGFDFIAELSPLDISSAEGQIPSPINSYPSARTSRVAPDGLHAAFNSTAPLTGYDNTDAQSGEPDAEVYLYDATAEGGEGRLVCASCNPSGTRPSGRKVASPITGSAALWAAARLPGWISQAHPGRFLSDDGSHLFFESFDALVPRDTNGRQDVYQWESSESKEDCLRRIGGELFVPSSSGCLSLISSGRSAEDSYLADASAGGRDVFFATVESLLAQDVGLRDLYSAREEGGFPPPPPPAAGCEGEACQGPLAAPDDPTPASVVEGAGNVIEHRRPHCARGKVRRKGRCISRKALKKRKRNASRRGRSGR